MTKHELSLSLVVTETETLGFAWAMPDAIHTNAYECMQNNSCLPGLYSQSEITGGARSKNGEMKLLQ